MDPDATQKTMNATRAKMKPRRPDRTWTARKAGRRYTPVMHRIGVHRWLKILPSFGTGVRVDAIFYHCGASAGDWLAPKQNVLDNRANPS
jgi:hypothetical protein